MNARAQTRCRSSYRNLWSLLLACCALWLANCSFDTAALDERRCDDETDCGPDEFCSPLGICQSVLADIVEDVDADVDMGEPDPCTDFDNDGVRGGVGCDDATFDCNDQNRLIYEGAPERCDGFDNDCDELIDTDDDDYIEEACPLTEGVCEGVNRACVGGNLQGCNAATYGDDYLLAEEGNEAACDDLDNDCDGDTDESIFRVCYDLSGVDADLLADVGESVDCDPTVDGDCVTLQGARPCSTGLSQCVEGEFSSTCEGQVVPATELTFETRCDSIDNDCDGGADEDCVCTPGEERFCLTVSGDERDDILGLWNCPDGTFEGLADCSPRPPCRVGRQVCGTSARFGAVVDGDFVEGACGAETLPAAETCGNPGIDNDCDGDSSPADIDVELGPGTTVPLGSSCETELDGICAQGTWQCVGDVAGLRCLTGTSICCVPNEDPEPETCSNPGEDNDCDGTEDNIEGEGDACRVTEFNGVPIYGQCQFGTLGCSGDDRLVCLSSSSSDEVCDNLDNDCDDDVDNGVDTLEDPDHCGACFSECGGGSPDCCEGGCIDLASNVFFCGDCDTDCTDDGSLSDPACCDSACTDLAFDSSNCGTCGFDCAGDTCCEGGCVDTQTDINHCGGCGMACDGDAEQCCGGTCVPKSDGDNCGACANDCTVAQTCRSVVDTDPDAECLDGPDDCYACKLRSDEAFCGPEGANCDDLDTASPTGSTDFECCDIGVEFACVDHLSDLLHCGSCGNDCIGVDPACCGAAGCRDLDSDEAHCGACGNDCAVDEQCCGGRCITLSNVDNCGACGNDCGASEGCCDLGGLDFTCVDLNNGVDRAGDIDFCGSCGVSCPGGGNIDCCSGFCTDLDVNNTHCGACGNACDVFDGELCCDDGGGMECRTNCP